MMTGAEEYKLMQSRLHQLRQRAKRTVLASGLTALISLTVILSFFIMIVEAVFRLSSPGRFILVSLWAGMLFFFSVYWIFLPLISYLFRKDQPDDDELALRIGENHPVRDRLANALQVFRQIEARPGLSKDLANASLHDACRETRDLDFQKAASSRKMFMYIRFLLISIVAFSVVYVLFHAPLSAAWGRLWSPQKDYPVEPLFSLTLLPGNTRVIQGDSVEIRVEAEGSVPSHISLLVREEEESSFREIGLSPPFRHSFPGMRNTINYYAEAGEVRTDLYRIEVVQRPLIRTFQIVRRPPEYSGWPVVAQDPDDGDMEVLPGTRIHLEATANKPLSKASLVWKEGITQAMKVDSRKISGSFTVMQAGNYWMALEDTLGLTNTDPVSYRVQVITDYPPIARVLFPGKNSDLDESMTLSLTLEGEDDFGISEGRLRCEILPGEGRRISEKNTFFIPLDLEENNPSRFLINYTWMLDTLALFPEDEVSYCLEVLDNDRVSGPKPGRSETYILRFPSIYEIFSEVDEVHDSQIESLEEMYSESQDLKESLDQIAEGLKGGKELEWEEEKNLESLIGEQKSMENKLEDLRSDMNDLVDRMERNDLIEMQTLEKYLELQELYREISDPALLEAMQKLQEMMNQVDKNLLQNAMQRFQLSQEAFLKSIERTLSLLKRLQIEQKTDELVKRIEDLVERQEKVNQEIKSGLQESQETAEKEEAIRTDAHDMREAMSDLYNKMEEIPGMPLTQLSESMRSLENILGQLPQVENMILSGEKNAGQKGEEALQSMTNLEQMLKQMQKELKEDQKEKVERALRRNAGRLLQLSEGQEELIRKEEDGVMNRDVVDKQMSLLSGVSQITDSLSQLARETFMITPKMGQAIGRARQQMQQSLEAMAGTGSALGQAHQKQAMAALNESVMALLDALRQLQQQQSGLGMEMFFQQMQQMAEQQMGINSQTLDMFQKGALSMEQQAALARIAAEQEMLKKRMESLLEEFGSRSDVLGRMDQTVKEMEQVIEELRTQQIKPETIERQERILSRMLDAQHSLRQRDYSRRRESRTGRDVVRRSPESAPEGTEKADRLRRDILRLTREGYTKAYQELIRQYYEMLSRLEK